MVYKKPLASHPAIFPQRFSPLHPIHFHGSFYISRRIFCFSVYYNIGACCPATPRPFCGSARGTRFVRERVAFGCYFQRERGAARARRTVSTLTTRALGAGPELQPPDPPASDPASTWLLLPKLAPCSRSSRGRPPPTQKEALVLAAFRRTDALLLPPPLLQLPTPFEYYTKVNGDASAVTQPRLLVLKLLTLSWCELQAYFDVYAGLPRLVRTRRVTLGSNYHKSLEVSSHSTVSLEAVEAAVRKHVDKWPEPLRGHVSRGGALPSALAYQWVEQILVRSLGVAYAGEAREVHVHGYIDLGAGELATDRATFAGAPRRMVLVNGIADVVRLEPVPRETAGAATGDLQPWAWDPAEVRQLTPELRRAKERMDLLARSHTLEVRDVKTRFYNNVPQQELVVAAARDQCLYYLQFLTTLSQSAEYGYASLMENLARRGVDGRGTLCEASAVTLLVTHFGVVVNDFLALARGEAIGFAAFDEAQVCPSASTAPKSADGAIETPGALDSLDPMQVEMALPLYSLANVLSENEFRELLAQFHGTLYADVDVAPLFRPWKTALTPAYFCARAAQALHLFERFEPSSVCVEYHNVRTQRIIECKQFEFDRDILLRRTKQAAGFWDGRRRPEPTTDRDRCSSCSYKSRCPAINETPTKTANVGAALADFLAAP